jgi:hypothetical protein
VIAYPNGWVSGASAAEPVFAPDDWRLPQPGPGAVCRAEQTAELRVTHAGTRRLPSVEIREAAIAAMGRVELEQLIDRAVRPDVPLRVLFAALDRYTELLRPVLDDEPAPPAGSAAAESEVVVLPATPRPRPTGPPGPPE